MSVEHGTLTIDVCFDEWQIDDEKISVSVELGTLAIYICFDE